MSLMEQNNIHSNKQAEKGSNRHIINNFTIWKKKSGMNEGIGELTLTLLIGIKADLIQFILYPDKLLKWSNSLIIPVMTYQNDLNIR